MNTPNHSQTLEHVNNATISALEDLCQTAREVRTAIESGNVQQARQLWHNGNLPQVVRTVTSFLKQTKFFESRQSSSSSFSHYNPSNINPSSLPEDPQELSNIISAATRKLTTQGTRRAVAA